MLEKCINEIQLLNEQCKNAFSTESFEKGNDLLNQRQKKVEVLVDRLNAELEGSKGHQLIVKFLEELLQDDNKQTSHFTALKKESLKQNIKQKKINNAVNKYKNIETL